MKLIRSSVFYFVAACILAVIGIFMLAGSSFKDFSFTKAPEVHARETVHLADGDIYELEAAPVTKMIGGKPQRMLAYNGSIPGPLIRVRQGDTVTIRFTNHTEFKTLLHSHGVRMENQYDGTQLVQKEMEPGEQFDYKLTFPDPGVFFYHPHVRDDMEQPLGLYGNFVVEPRDLNYWGPANREEVLTIGDILIDDNGTVAPYYENKVTHALMGRYGNVMLVNGEESYELHANKGEVVRFYLTNVASSRPFGLQFTGARMKVVGGDVGAFEKEYFTDSLLINPSERIIVDVLFPESGLYSFEHRTPQRTYRLGTIRVSDEVSIEDHQKSFTIARSALPEDLAAFASARSFTSTPLDKTLQLTVATAMHHNHAMHGQGGGTIEWEDMLGFMNAVSTNESTRWIIRDVQTGKENMDVNWTFTKGSMVKIRIINDPNAIHPMQHPIHFHGNYFYVLSQNGVPTTNMVRKDTALVPTGEYIDVLLTTENPGAWMTHCHILEHLHSGMMIGYQVI